MLSDTQQFNGQSQTEIAAPKSPTRALSFRATTCNFRSTSCDGSCALCDASDDFTAVFNGRDGQLRLFNGVDNKGGLTRWFGNDGKVRALMAVARHGGDLTLSGGQRARFAAGVGVNDSGLVEILGSDGKPRARIGVLNGSGAVVVLDSKGRILATLP